MHEKSNFASKFYFKYLLFINQGMIKFLEEEIFLQVRKEDVNLVKTLIPECEKEYAEIMLKETKNEYKTKLHILEE